MGRKITLLFPLLFLLFTAGAQSITGIWRGYFIQSSFGLYEDRYKFEIQIEQSTDNAVKGVTYSYKTTVFYGKATLQGVYTKKTRNLVLKELKLVEVKIGEDSQPCLMTCYLEYDKMGKLETMSGTYTSRNLKDKADCGSGRVYLERTLTSDFYKEDFLVKKENEAKKKPIPLVKKTVPKPQPNTVAKSNPPARTPQTNKTTATTKPVIPRIKPGAENNVVVKPKEKITDAPIAEDKKDAIGKARPIEKNLPPAPEVFRRRNNELVKTFSTSAKQIKIELYDNGEIDGDTITVYHNNQVILSKKRLTDKPLSFTISVNEDEPYHEFVMVAENLGSIPPNTALMIITAGMKRYETHVTSTEKKNAVVVVEYKPNGMP